MQDHSTPGGGNPEVELATLGVLASGCPYSQLAHSVRTVSVLLFVVRGAVEGCVHPSAPMGAMSL